jgi:2-polyprenyl-6-hydroxyphenyl methylase/3-demethylubiquinone-9 3-methyltransferase
MSLPVVKPVAEQAAICKICRGKAPLFGVVDFNKSCEDRRGTPLSPAGVPVHYRRCAECGFLFTASLDDWSLDDFRTHIYNDGYAAVDPDYLEARPTALAATLAQLLPALPLDTGILDYGGGNGVLAERLRARGCRHVETYDPLTPAFAHRPAGRFPLITSFETFEHVPDPIATIRDIATLASQPGLVLFSTLLQGQELQRAGMDWWYIGPRNGHISLYTQRALVLAWGRVGYRLVSLSAGMHAATRQPPEFAAHLFKSAEPGPAGSSPSGG